MALRTKYALALALTLTVPAMAGWLPLWFDMPKRDNPNDPFSKRGSSAVFQPALPTPTPVCVPGTDFGIYGFEDTTTQGWTSSGSGGYDLITGIANTAVTVCKGSRALCGTVNFTHGGANKKAIFYRTYTGSLAGKKLQATAYFAPGMSAGGTQVKMWIKSTGGFVYSNGPSFDVPAAGGWVGTEFDLAQPPAFAAGVTNTADLREIGLEIYSPIGEPDGPFTVCVDSWEYLPRPTPTITPTPAFGTPTSTATPSPTPSATPTPVCGGASDTSTYGFEDGTPQGWGSATAGGYELISGIANGTTPVCAGSRSICGNLDLSAPAFNTFTAKAIFYRSYSGSLAGKVLTAQAYFPAGMSAGNTQVKMWIKSTGSFVYSNGPSFNVPAGGGWLGASFDMNAAPAFAAGATNTADVREIGLELYIPAAEPNGSYSICMDAYNIP